eukprot:8363200-Pyramimonas_sp.AAC.1
MGHGADLEHLLLKRFATFNIIEVPTTEQKKMLRLDISKEMGNRQKAGAVQLEDLDELLGSK